MSALTKRFTLFATLMVVLSLALGMTVVGCADNDRNSQETDTTKITYRFAQLMTPTKAKSGATQAKLTAYNAKGAAVYAKQDETAIDKHKDITPTGTVGSTTYEGTASVLSTATTLVLAYYDANGKEVGTKDAITVSSLKEGAIIDFTTAGTNVTWTPADANITIVADDPATAITAKDKEGTVLTVTLTSEDTEHITIVDNEITGRQATDAPITVTATAKDTAGEIQDTKIYSITVDGPVEWAPYRTNLTLPVGSESEISAQQGGVALDVTLTSDDTEHITIEGTKITGKAAFDEAIEVTATAKDAQGNVVGTRIYSIKVYANVTWTPADANITIVAGNPATAVTAENEEGTVLTVTLTSEDTEHITIVDNEITGRQATDAPITVTATAKNMAGEIQATKVYSITVDPPVEWSPYRTNLTLYVDGESEEISAKQDNVALDVTLTSDDTEHITIEGTKITGKATCEEAIEVTATAKDAQGNVVGTRIYSIKVGKKA